MQADVKVQGKGRQRGLKGKGEEKRSNVFNSQGQWKQIIQKNNNGGGVGEKEGGFSIMSRA